MEDDYDEPYIPEDDGMDNNLAFPELAEQEAIDDMRWAEVERQEREAEMPKCPKCKRPLYAVDGFECEGEPGRQETELEISCPNCGASLSAKMVDEYHLRVRVKN